MHRPSPLGRTAVLRGADQREGRAPTHCVISGDSTSGAVQVRAGSTPHVEIMQLLLGYTVAGRLSRRSLSTTLPVTPRSWGIWRRRLGAAIVVTAIGGGVLGAGVVRGQVGLIVTGTLILVAGVLSRAWFARVRWVGVRYDPERDLVLVSRASMSFDEDAKARFVAGLGR